MTTHTRPKYFAVILLLLAVLTAGAIWLGFSKNDSGIDGVACTMEAKLCPDGSYVGREGPNCEFAECPAGDGPGAGFDTYRDEARGISFIYPTSFQATYIEAVDWPPQVNLVDEEFSCTEAGDSASRTGITELREVDGREYCVTEIVEAAAGSVYTQYAYATIVDGMTAIFTASIRAPQCANFSDDERLACEAERGIFDFDEVMHGVAESLSIN